MNRTAVILFSFVFVLFSFGCQNSENDTERTYRYTAVMTVLVEEKTLLLAEEPGYKPELDNFIALVKSNEVITQTIDQLNKVRSIDELKAAISVTESEESAVLKITFQDDDSDFAKTFVEKLVTTTSEHMVASRFAAVDVQLAELNTEMDDLSAQIEVLEQEGEEIDPTLERQYMDLLERKMKLEIEKAGIYSNVRIIEGARVRLN